MVSFCAVLFPRDVLDDILDLIKSVFEGFPTWSLHCILNQTPNMVNDLCVSTLLPSKSRRQNFHLQNVKE